MRTAILLILISMGMLADAQAQEKVRFGSQNTIGLLEGSSGSAFQLLSINGVRYKTWFTGVGTGLDYYYLRSVPLFLSVQKDFFNKKRTPFISLDAGTNFHWDKKSSNGFINYSSDYEPRLYYAGGLGYKFGMRNRDAFLINIGYSFKHLREIRETPTMCLNPPCQPIQDEFNYELKRLMIRIGYMF